LQAEEADARGLFGDPAIRGKLIAGRLLRMKSGGGTGRAAGRFLLDERLGAAYGMVPPCRLCADIGADHGKLSAALLEAGRAERMLVADISEMALAKARRLLAYARLSERAVFAVADGLDALDALEGEPVDVACILGMGGDTMAGVLQRGAHRLCGATLVLGAQTELPALRQALCDIGYRLREERIAEAAGRAYVLMRAAPATQEEAPYTDRELLLGPCLLREPTDAWERMLRRRTQLLETAEAAMRQAGNHKDSDRLCKAERELTYLREVLAGIQRRHLQQGSEKGEDDSNACSGQGDL
jgi:tRNA (adenine22-N1)-methyltransferase